MTNKARVLFVDDEKRVLNSMRGLFRRDYELFLTNEGAEAVNIASENEIDVIVADQRMPGMTGIEVLAKIKEKSPRTIRILLTGYADPSAVEGSINIGEVFRFLSKPCPPKMLRETLSLATSAARTKPAAMTAAATSTPPSAPPDKSSTHLSAPRLAPMLQKSPTLVPVHDFDQTHPALPTLDEAAAQYTSEHSPSDWQSVSNVVLSEDTVEETQETVALTSSTLGVNDVGVVIFTVDPSFATAAIRAASSERNTIIATKLVNVVEAVEQQNAGVLVTDFTTSKAILQKIIGALKQHMPELVTVVVSDGKDTADMINLINYGQIFRYLLKPIEHSQLRSDINAAVIRHLYLLNNPESVKRYQVIGTRTTATPANVHRVLGKISEM